MTQGITNHYNMTSLDKMLPAPIRSLPLVPAEYRLTVSPAGTIISASEAPTAKPTDAAPQNTDGARLELHI